MERKYILGYYTTPGMMTDPGEYADLLLDLPPDVGELVKSVQNNMIHIFWLPAYQIELPDERKETVNVRSVREKLKLMWNENPCPLCEPRPLAERQVGNCRDFSVLLTAMLRGQGIPARARAGFGAYFTPGHYEDHWVVEYWCAKQNRWVWVDPQLDALMVNALKLDFDPLDMPPGKFITGGQAWQMCRRGEANPADFGIFDMSGWWFIWGDVIRDYMSLNKVEILPWDGGWGYLDHTLDEPLVGEDTLVEFDRIAALTLAGEAGFDKLRSRFENDPGFKLPEDFR